MNILIDYLPESVEVNGAEYEINSDFRTSILFELLMQDPEIDETEKALSAIDLYFNNESNKDKRFDTNIFKGLIDAMMWFYGCGKEEAKQSKDEEIEGEEPVRHNELIYNFNFDDEYIYGAYLTQYGIDLNSIDYLHWWKFRAMMKGLDSELQFVKIMGYRAIEITSDMSKSEKKHYTKMKKLYALPDLRTEEEKERDFASTFCM